MAEPQSQTLPWWLRLVVRSHALGEAPSLKVTSGAEAVINRCNGNVAAPVRGYDLHREERSWGS
jgi:hypothetical protein